MICTICRKQRHELTPKQSELMPQMKLLLCNSCMTSRYEPRHVIIIVGRSMGYEEVKDYIERRRYLGEEITARELLA
jgi:hypothetical protein